jgi:iron(III) transport system ATP-binding protein
MSTALQLESVSVERHGNRLLDHVDLHLEAGSILALTGPSGSGKTTLLRAIVGLEAPTGGQITIFGRPVFASGRIQVAPEDRGVSIVFQDLGLWPHMNVGEHLHFALITKRLPKRERCGIVRKMLHSVGLEDRERQRPATLSGGERQRLAIARALVTSPSLVLLDEPLSNLDVVLKHELIAVMASVLTVVQSSAIFVTHDPREALPLTRRFAVLEHGRIVQHDDVAELSRFPATSFVRELIARSNTQSALQAQPTMR